MDGTPQDRLCSGNDFYWSQSAQSGMWGQIGQGAGVNLSNIAFGIGDALTASPWAMLFGATSLTQALRQGLAPNIHCVIPENGFYYFGGIWAGLAAGSAANGLAGGVAATTGRSGVGIGEAVGTNLTTSEQRAINSFQKLITKHTEKLDAYKANPDAYDNLGNLARAPLEQIRQNIISGRSSISRPRFALFRIKSMS